MPRSTAGKHHLIAASAARSGEITREIPGAMGIAQPSEIDARMDYPMLNLRAFPRRQRRHVRHERNLVALARLPARQHAASKDDE
jgi:hypothetical protein